MSLVLYYKQGNVFQNHICICTDISDLRLTKLGHVCWQILLNQVTQSIRQHKHTDKQNKYANLRHSLHFDAILRHCNWCLLQWYVPKAKHILLFNTYSQMIQNTHEGLDGADKIENNGLKDKQCIHVYMLIASSKILIHITDSNVYI